MHRPGVVRELSGRYEEAVRTAERVCFLNVLSQDMLSELIEKLRVIYEADGDIPVMYWDPEVNVSVIDGKAVC